MLGSEQQASTKNEENKEGEENEKEYEIAPISKLEFSIYLIYWFGILISGCYAVYILANRPRTLKYFRTSKFVRKSYFGLWQSNVEYLWEETVDVVNRGTRYFALYVFVSKLLRARLSPVMFMLCCTVLALVLNCYHSALKFLLFEAAILLIPIVIGCIGSKILVWISSLTMLYMMKDFHKYPELRDKYIFEGAYGYTGLLITRAIAAGLMVAEASKLTMKLFIELNFYYWYFPAIIGCRMMVVKDFIAQVYQPYVIQNWRAWFSLAFRVILWYCIWTIVSALVPFFLITQTHELNYIDFNVVVGGQLYFGIHFFIIYFISYNMSYLVTQFDGFLTPEGPICICHVALYSKLWKTFDISMHLWIKEYIFRPIARSGDFKKTKIYAVIASFSFVVIFHGLGFDTILWITLNVLQFILHGYLVRAFSHSPWGLKMQRTFSPAWIRRYIAVLGAISWFTSIYGFAVFCHGFANASKIYATPFHKYHNPYYCRVLIIAVLFYCHSQMSLSANAYLAKRKSKIQ